MSLEYSPPARGSWTIAHVPLLIPDAYVIFVGASCCMRGVMLSAAECGALDRFSAILVKEDDLFGGKMEEMFISGTENILNALTALPPCVVLFSGCIHEAAGSDMEYVQKTLEAKFPTVDFIMSKMNPTMRKSGITPEELMRMQLYAPLGRPPSGEKSRCIETKNKGKANSEEYKLSVNIIGNIAPRSGKSEVLAMLNEAGYKVKDLCCCKTYYEYLDMENSCLNVYMSPVAKKGAVALSERLGQRLFYFPVTFDMNALEDTLRSFADSLSLKMPDTAALKSEAMEALEKAAEAARGMKIAADFSAVSRPFELLRLLFESGFDVRRMYTDTVAAGDEAACEWCKANIPHFEVISVTNTESRFLHKEAKDGDDEWLAIGQKAAYFCNTTHFVNIIENGSLWGFKGITEMAQMIECAAHNTSDMRQIIQVKAWGCKEAIDSPSLRGRRSRSWQSSQCEALRRLPNAGSNGIPLPSTYSADLFGMCNALCELGGLVVMHDASGCNSTYCTHDEPRWFDTDSMIYISALTEEDVIMGRDEKLINDIVSAVAAARKAGHSPRFVAIGGSPMPFMVGCDMKAVAHIVEERTGIPALGLECGGIRDYTAGAGASFAWLVDTFCTKAVPPSKREQMRAELPHKKTINILGLTPLDFSIERAKGIADCLEGKGEHIIGKWAMGSTLEDIERAGLADENAVVSATGFDAAKRLKALYGTPYTVGVNVEGVIDCRGIAQWGMILIIGEAVFASSLRKYLKAQFGAQDVRILCPLEETCGLLGEGDLHTDDGSKIIQAMKEASTIIADPLYKRMMAKDSKAHFVAIAHTAYSGRMFF